MRSKGALAVAGCLIWLAAGAGAAPAAVVTAQDGMLRVTAPAGETNAVTIAGSQRPDAAADEVQVTDTGAVLIAGAGCESVTPSTAVCRRGGHSAWVNVHLADGNDSVKVATNARLLQRLYGGPGDDVLAASPEPPAPDWYGWGFGAYADGGPGDDRITTGVGTDTVFGGPGDDTVDTADNRDFVCGGSRGEAGGDWRFESCPRHATGTGHDVLNGGAGEDVVRAGDGNDRIADTDPGPDTTPVDDELGSVVGSFDILQGEAGNDEILGGGGQDQIYGGAGDDDLYAGGAWDQVFGDEEAYGPVGDDMIFIRDDFKDFRTYCGAGFDRVVRDPVDRIAGEGIGRYGYDCEDIAPAITPAECEAPPYCYQDEYGDSFEDLEVGRDVAVRSTTAYVRVRCPDYRRRCAGRVSLTGAIGARATASAWPRIGTARFSIRSGRTSTVRVRISVRAARTVSRRGHLRGRARTSARAGIAEFLVRTPVKLRRTRR